MRIPNNQQALQDQWPHSRYNHYLLSNTPVHHGSGIARPHACTKRRITFFVIVIACTMLGCLAGLELYAYCFLPPADLQQLTGRSWMADPRAHWADLDAYCAYRAKPGRHRFYSIQKSANEHGFISTPSLGLEKPGGTIRLAFFGGSSTAGSHLADDQTWPYKVTQLLRQRFADTQIQYLNAGLSGFTTFESYGRFWSRVRFYDIDIAVIYHGWNDMRLMVDHEKPPRFRTLPDGSWGFVQHRVKLQVYEPWPIDPWIQWSKGLTFIRLWLSPRSGGEATDPEGDRALSDSWNRKHIDFFRTNLELFRRSADALGVDLFIAKQATLVVPDLAPQDRQRVLYESVGAQHDLIVDMYAASYEVIDAGFRPDRVIDPTHLSGQSEYFFDHVHLTSAGTDQLAKSVADAIEPAVRRQRRQH